MEVSLITAFLGGVLALLSPCGALLLPAFFASAAATRLRLLLHGTVFYTGLVLTLVPLGLGLGALGSLIHDHRDVLIVGTSVLLIGLGIAQVIGLGFDPSTILPGARAVHRQAHRRRGLVRALLLGAASGVAGFCAGPILGAILTLALAEGDTLSSGFLLAVYGAGMVVPLMLLAAVWDRIGPRTMALIRGRGFTIAGRRLHTTSVVTGLLIAGIGVLFWSTNGLVSMPSLVPTSWLARVQAQGTALSGTALQIVVVVLAAAALLTIWALLARRRERTEQSDPTGTGR